MGRPGFHFTTMRVGRGHQQLALYDVAAAGISFIFEVREGFKVGDEVEGKLQVPGCEPFSVYLELRNVRPLPGDAKRKLAGCRFVGLVPSSQEALAQALAKLN